MKSLAQKCFEENARLFAPDPRQNPREHNLFTGLASLSEQVSAMQQQLQAQSHALRHLQQALSEIQSRMP